MRARPIIARVPKDQAIRGVEVGVWKGKLSERLLRHLPLLHLTLVDRWAPPRPEDSYYDSDTISRVSQQSFDGALEMVTEIAKANEGRVVVIQGPSLDVSTLFNDASQDFVFIDADHTYPGVKRDIEAWLPKVKPGGLLCGHDYGQALHPGVQTAVDEATEKLGYELELDEDHTWFWRIPE